MNFYSYRIGGVSVYGNYNGYDDGSGFGYYNGQGNGGDWCNSNWLGYQNNMANNNYMNGMVRLIDEQMQAYLVKLGFTYDEICLYNMCMQAYGKVTSQLLTKEGVAYNIAHNINYMKDIIEGKVTVSSEDELIKHLKKMNLSNKKVGMWDLVASKEIKPKRKCLVAGMPVNTPFVLYNSGKEKTLRQVTDVTGSFVTIASDIIPKLPYGDSKKLVRLTDMRENKMKYYRDYESIPKQFKEDEGRYKTQTVAEILETDGKHILVKIHRDYVRICGRYIIVASLRVPDNHLGMINIITLDGTRVYVYAKQASFGDQLKYSKASERIYDYGFDINEIQGKLMNWGGIIYKKVGGVYANNVPATAVFQVIEDYVEIDETVSGNDAWDSRDIKTSTGNNGASGSSSSSSDDDDW